MGFTIEERHLMKC